MMVASHKPLGRKESLIQIVARRLSSKQRPGSAARLGEEEVPEALSETSAEIGGVGGGGGEGSERKQSLVDMLAARFSRTPRQLRVGGSQIEGDTSDESVEGTPETERRESLVKKISRRFSRTPKLQLKLGDEDLEFIMLHTGLEKEAVELHFKQFQRSHPGGVMDPAGLRAMLQVDLVKVQRYLFIRDIWVQNLRAEHFDFGMLEPDLYFSHFRSLCQVQTQLVSPTTSGESTTQIWTERSRSRS